MLRSRPFIFFILSICILLSLMPSTIVKAGDELDVPWYLTPKIDGWIGLNEYPPQAVSILWGDTSICKLYVCQNSSYLFIAIDIPDTTCQPNDRVTIWLGKEPPSPERTPRYDDYRVTATRDGRWSVDRLKITNASTTESSCWYVEMAVGFSELAIKEGRSRAIAIFIEDNNSIKVRWPEDAQEGNPKTWAKLYSTYSWGTIELVLDTPTINPRDPIAGQNVTINVGYRNDGTSPAENVTIAVYVDDSLIFNETGRIDSHVFNEIPIPWRATYGNHTINVKLDPNNRIFEKNENNNNAAISIFVRLARLKVKAPQGVSITAGEQMKNVGSEGEVTFDVPVGRLDLSAQEAIYEGDTRNVFRRWSNGENRSKIELTITKDLEIEASYKKENRLRLIFMDSKGSRALKPSMVMISAPNGSMIELNDTYDVWVQEGTFTISNIIWSGINVKPENTTYAIRAPMTLKIRCRVYDVVVNVKDAFEFPIQGANVTLLLPNQTSVWSVTDEEGRAAFTNIPVGKIDGSVSNLGITTPIGEREIKSDYAISVSIPLSINTIIILIVASAGILSTLLIIWLKRGTKKQSTPEPLRSLGPPI